MTTNLQETLATLTARAATTVDQFRPYHAPLHAAVIGHPWRFATYHAELAPIMPAVLQYASDVLSRSVAPYWLTLLGPSGVGKTFILAQLYEFLRKHENLWMVSHGTGHHLPTCAHIKPAADLDHYASPREYAHRDLCYIEDIGSGSGLEHGAGAVQASRITELLQLRSRRWTLLDANLSRAKIAELLDSRIASRLRRDENVLIQISGDVPDYSDRKKERLSNPNEAHPRAMESQQRTQHR